jgi:hypothetical protein
MMERANRLEPEALNGVLEATRWPNPVERAQPLIEALFERLRAQGFDRSETNQLLGALEEWSTPDEVRAASDATIDALSGTDLPRVRGLQQALRASPVLRALFRASPEQLRTWWRDYIRWPRPYRFGLYSWFRMHHIRGALGEWTSAFDLGRSGVLIFLKGPKPEVTTGGTDLVAIDRNTGEVYSIDNKATLRTRVLRGVTALMRNFPQNLAEDVRALRADIAGRLEPAIESVLRRLESAERRIRAVVELLGPEGEARKQALDDNVEVTLRSGERVRVQQAITDILQEHGITRLITNAGGVLERISTALEEAGIEIENLNEVVEDPVDTE